LWHITEVRHLSTSSTPLSQLTKALFSPPNASKPFGCRALPGPAGEAHSAPPDAQLVSSGGPPKKGKEGKKGMKEGGTRHRKEEGGREGGNKGREEERQGGWTPQFLRRGP